MHNLLASVSISGASILIDGSGILLNCQDLRSLPVMAQCKDLWARIMLSDWLRNGKPPKNYSYVLLFLAAIITANLSSTYFGSKASIINAFLFIGFNITCRDKLHEVWHKNGLVYKMALLLLSGSAISYLINADSGMIAIASFIAFVLSTLADTLIYSVLFKRSKIIKINGSNIASSLIDSITFPTIAFGAFMPLIILGQFLTKMFGGFIWSLILSRKMK
jgi:queuosine precursor transporter